MSTDEGPLSSRFAARFPTYPASVLPIPPVASADLERHFKHFGGRYITKPEENVALQAEWFKRRFWDYVQKFQRVELYADALRRVSVDYVDNPSLNAFVGESGDYALIGLFVGAVWNLGIFFQVLLSHPLVLPRVGVPGRQAKWFEDLSDWNWSFSVASALKSFRESNGGWPQLALGERSVFAGYLTMFAMDFLFFHELGHWCQGHDRYVKRIAKEFGPFVDELGPCPIPAIPSQVLELQADSFAATLMVNEWFHASFRPPSIFRSTSEALRTWAIAMAFTFILFGQERLSATPSVGIYPHPWLLRPHPDPSVRLENLHLEAWKIARMFSREAVSSFDQEWQAGLREVSEACRILKIPSSIWRADVESVEKTYRLLCINAIPLHDEIAGHSRLKLPEKRSA